MPGPSTPRTASSRISCRAHGHAAACSLGAVAGPAGRAGAAAWCSTLQLLKCSTALPQVPEAVVPAALLAAYAWE